MNKIINKRRVEQYVRLDRELMRDTRLKSNHKLLYALFCSLSESCENVFPSYSWLATEVGYEYNGKAEKGSIEAERAMKAFISDNLQPLIDLGLIVKIVNNGGTCDYEVYDFDRVEKSTPTVKKKVHGNRVEKSTLEKEDIEKEEERVEQPTFLIENNIKELLESKFPDLVNFPALYKIVQAIENKAPKNYKEYINFVAENKKGEKVFIAKYWQEYFFEDFWVKNRDGSTEIVHRNDLNMYQRDNETVTEFEARCINRENLGDVRIIKHYTKTTEITRNDLKSKFEMAKKAMLEAKTISI